MKPCQSGKISGQSQPCGYITVTVELVEGLGKAGGGIEL